jgi:wobble nucleotide-excising tRNase
MLTEIKLNGFASFKHETCLRTDKPINFVYGLNGTGKSSLTRYLAHRDDPKYAQCSITPAIDPDKEEILVYNQDYISETFVDKDRQNGVFTLSKQNKKAYDAIQKATQKLAELDVQDKAIEEAQKKSDATSATAESQAKDKLWELKTKYSGGDRVLDYCLEGYKGSKVSLFTKVKETEIKPDDALRPIETLKQDLIQLTAVEGQSYPLLQEAPNLPIKEEDISLLKKVIVGNQESTISDVMDEFANAAWVRTGIQYIDKDGHRCPFCHQETITEDFLNELKNYFDESYEHDIQALQLLEQTLNDTLARVVPDTGFEDIPIIAPLREKYLLAFQDFKAAITASLATVRLKIERPNIEQELSCCQAEVDTVNTIIKEANKQIAEFNARVAKLPEVKESIKEEFWKFQRREYDATLSAYDAAVKAYKKDTAENEKKKEEVEKQRKQQRSIITDNQKDVVNIDEAITHINNNLQSIGITDFHIVKCEGENAYRISRAEEGEEKVFHTLSEGEKMLISFLYFIETCTGRKAADEPEKKKIIVIDDPISSLSHIHIFNVGRLILNSFVVDQPFEQVFILTHSLYFFYEIVDTNHKRRNQFQKLLRITKRANGSEIEEMHYHELHNDYETYWSIINDPDQHPALIANCMRNVLDYYFGFVERLEYHSLFELPELSEPRFAAFDRFMNRESHSIGENIIDIKEFDYNAFRDALRLVFKTKGHEKHFDLMSTVGVAKA